MNAPIDNTNKLRTSRTIEVRKLRFAFDALPKHWMGGSALGTAMSNTLNLIFPMGERFFVRSVRSALDELRVQAEADPEAAELLEQVKAFSGQEGLHAREHERFFEAIAEHHDIEPFLRVYKAIAYDFLEPRVPAKLRLAVTAACEHFTATFAHDALTTDRIESAPQVVQDLFRWHAAEEIEHKAVAFDVLMRVEPGYVNRMLGLALAATTLGGFWIMGTLMLLAQDSEVTWRRLLNEARHARQIGALANGSMLQGVLTYGRRGFHPDQLDDYGLAEQAVQELASKGYGS